MQIEKFLKAKEDLFKEALSLIEALEDEIILEMINPIRNSFNNRNANWEDVLTVFSEVIGFLEERKESESHLAAKVLKILIDPRVCIFRKKTYKDYSLLELKGMYEKVKDCGEKTSHWREAERDTIVYALASHLLEEDICQEKYHGHFMSIEEVCGLIEKRKKEEDNTEVLDIKEKEKEEKNCKFTFQLPNVFCFDGSLSMRGEIIEIFNEIKKSILEIKEKEVYFDFEKISYISSLCLGSICDLNKMLKDKGKELVFIKMSDNIYEFFKLIGLEKIFKIEGR